MRKSKNESTAKQDEEEEEDECKKANLTAEQTREWQQLDKLNCMDDLKSINPDEKLAIEAKLFLTLDLYKHANRASKEKALLYDSIFVPQGVIDFFASETKLDKAAAEKLLKENKSNLKAAMKEFVHQFPHTEPCRSPLDVVGTS